MKRGILVIALVSAPLLADDVYLRGGGQLTGEIVERTKESVTVDVGGGTMTVPLSSVVRIDGGVSPLQEYRARAGSIPDADAEAWRELGRWARQRGLAVQAREAYTKVVAIVPDDPEANRALGRVLLDGRWVTEDESYRARGYVDFEGEWMTPGEQQAILQDRRDQEESDRQMLAAQIQAEQEAEKEKEAQEAAEDEEFWHDALPRSGDPIFWGWGAGPGYWPYQPGQQPERSR